MLPLSIQFQSIILQIPESHEVTLNFAGVAVLTDTVIAIMSSLRNTNTARFDSVKSVVLNGCYLVTDAGLTWLGEAFPCIVEVRCLAPEAIFIYINS